MVAALPRPLRSPVHGGWIRAVLFDLDGTLYHQGPLRALMALELLTMPLVAPTRAPRNWRALRAFRRAQEALRAGSGPVGGDSQLRAAAAWLGCEPEALAPIVDEWMRRRPLKYLRVCRPVGLLDLLDLFSGRGIRCGVLSDYPADDKLRALGLDGRFDPVLCSTDQSIQALKPNPRGFLRASELWQIDPREVLVVGDRVDVDAEGAAAAGMPCVIIGRTASGSDRTPYVPLASLKGLHRVLSDRSR